MKRPSLFQISAAILFAAYLLMPAAVAHASSLTITYYTIGENDRDANTMCCAVISNEVLDHLGVNGLPVLNPAANGGSLLPKDILADNEITYWSPSLNNGGTGGISDVVKTGTGTISLPFANDSFYPPNGTGSNDSEGFQAAVLSGNLFAGSTEVLSFSIGSDDMAFAYIDGSLVCDDGGVHGNASVPCTTPTIAAGNHTLQVFFVDMNNTGSALDFSIQTTDVNTNPVVTPEPGTLTMLGSGLAALAGLVRRKITKSV